MVRNLPRKATEDDVRSHFEECGTITDVRLLTSEDGKPRRVAFVGFKEPGLCQEIIRKMGGTYILTSRVFIEPAKTRGEIARAERLSREEREAQEAERKARKRRGALDVLESLRERGGAELEEFLSVARQRAWEDGVVAAGVGEGGKGGRVGTEGRAAKLKGDRDAGSGEGPSGTAGAARPREGESRGARARDEANNSDSDVQEEALATATHGPDAEKSAARLALLGAPVTERDAPLDSLPDIDDARVKLTGLPPGITEDELAEAFARYGTVSEAVVCIDRLSKERTGVGFVTFSVPEAASRALKAEERIVQGKIVRISPARALRGSGEALGDGVRRREYLARGRDAHNRLAWSATYQRPDTVASLVGRRLSLETADVAGNAVGMAVAEAVLAGEARERLEAAGLVVDAGDAASAPRSKTAILCKNLPEDVDAREIQALFAVYGAVASCEIPYPGFALVFMAEPADARRAFSRLAFKRVGAKKAPMFLEYAMLQDVSAGSASPADSASPAADQNPGAVTVRIKNVSFSTSNDEFRKICGALPGHISSRLVMNPKGHSGYGFATFRAAKDAEEAIARLNKTIQAGFRWSAELSASDTAARGLDPRGYSDDNLPETSKLIVKNLAFQASGKELKQLLGQFGTLVSFRAPKKIDGTLRGFAFAEYATPKDALEAARRISATHFYGRHLVPEFSTKEEGLGAAEDADGRGSAAAEGPRRRQKL